MMTVADGECAVDDVIVLIHDGILADDAGCIRRVIRVLVVDGFAILIDDVEWIDVIVCHW